MPQHQPHDRNTQHLAKIPLPALTRQPSVLVVQPIVLVSQVQAVFAVRVGQPASCCLFFFAVWSVFLLLQKTNQTATTKINVKFDHCYVTARLDHVCLLFPDWPMNGELVSVRLYSMWDEEASRISVVFTDEAFVEVVLEKPRGSPPKGSV